LVASELELQLPRTLTIPAVDAAADDVVAVEVARAKKTVAVSAAAAAEKQPLCHSQQE
jgi:hypothetical protein